MPMIPKFFSNPSSLIIDEHKIGSSGRPLQNSTTKQDTDLWIPVLMGLSDKTPKAQKPLHKSRLKDHYLLVT